MHHASKMKSSGSKWNVLLLSCCCWWLWFFCCLSSSCFVVTFCSSHRIGQPTTTSSSVKGHDYLRSLLSSDEQSAQHKHRNLQVPPYPRQYHIRSSAEIKEMLDEWNTRYAPNLVRITTSQDTYQLPAAGTKDDCPFYDGGDGCPNYIVTIQDFVAHPEGSYSSNRLPEVLWSGCLHGDERVGPTSVMEAADILLAAAACEALPKYPVNFGGDGIFASTTMDNTQQYQQELKQAISCRQALAEQGIDDAHRQWLARLVSTRRIVIVPTANALGYFRDQRTENIVDPNRDFPYDLTDPTKCMQTIAARTLNEVFQEHLFQLSLTFHAGMEVVGYEWGAPSWLQRDSPDDQAQAQIASAYSQYAGGWSQTQPYAAGSMNSLVYPVNGGMEDWAYAGSFDAPRVITCKPKSYGGYPPQKTKYSNGTLRVFNMLVETSNDKTPSKGSLGNNKDVLEGKDLPSNGHVARNLRLALLAADLVEPYLSITQVNDVRLSDDIVPLTYLKQEPSKCQAIRAVQVPTSASADVTLQWTVGGALRIDKTAIFFAKWESLPEDALDCLGQPSLDYNLTSLMQTGGVDGYSHGTGYFSAAGPYPVIPPRPPAAAQDNSNNGEPAAAAAAAVLGPVFRGKLDLSSFAPHDRIAVVVAARVDQDWSEQPSLTNVEPKIPPQSHIVNARTNPSWHFENAGKHIHGRLDWFSAPLTIVIGEAEESADGGSGSSTIELSNRFAAIDFQKDPSDNGTNKNKSSEDEAGKRSLRQMSWTRVVGLLLIVAASAATCAVIARSRENKRHQRLVNELYNEEHTFHHQQKQKTKNKKHRTRDAASSNEYYYTDQIDENFDDEEDDEDVVVGNDKVGGELHLKAEEQASSSSSVASTGGGLSRNGEVEMQRYTIT